MINRNNLYIINTIKYFQDYDFKSNIYLDMISLYFHLLWNIFYYSFFYFYWYFLVHRPVNLNYLDLNYIIYLLYITMDYFLYKVYYENLAQLMANSVIQEKIFFQWLINLQKSFFTSQNHKFFYLIQIFLLYKIYQYQIITIRFYIYVFIFVFVLIVHIQ